MTKPNILKSRVACRFREIFAQSEDSIFTAPCEVGGNTSFPNNQYCPL